MKRKLTGRYTEVIAGGVKVKALIPDALPPMPGIDLSGKLLERFSDASLALGRLDTLSMVPDLEALFCQYVRKEAVLSSQIEGTQSTLDDLLKYEDGDVLNVPCDDVIEVSNYASALTYGLDRLSKNSVPLSLRLIKEIHGKLLSNERGSKKRPGELRLSQNWLSGSNSSNAVFVPTPPHEILKAMVKLENFINDKSQGLPALIVAGLAHVQFETIHPFLDGNGRLGRMLILLILCERGVLKAPYLYLSLFLKQNRSEYYERLQEVRINGDWEGWLEFFLEGITMSASTALSSAMRINEIYKIDREELLSVGKKNLGITRTHEYMYGNFSATPTKIARETGLSMPTVNKALNELESVGVVVEATGKRRGKRYLYTKVFKELISDIGI